jgi:hypothetical protein
LKPRTDKKDKEDSWLCETIGCYAEVTQRVIVRVDSRTVTCVYVCDECAKHCAVQPEDLTEDIDFIFGHNGCICIVEEIVDEWFDEFWRRKGGMYSLYGWKQPNPYHEKEHRYLGGEHGPWCWYFGDHLGYELETTGHIASAKEVLKHGRKCDPKATSLGFAADIQYIVANLGKTERMPRRRRLGAVVEE